MRTEGPFMNDFETTLKRVAAFQYLSVLNTAMLAAILLILLF